MYNNYYCKLGSLIWSSNYLKYKNELNNVQHKFLKKIGHVSNLQIIKNTVNVVENFLRLDSLSVRHKLTDVMLVYNILKNHMDIPELLSEIGFCMSNKNTRNVIYS